eukprot:16451804-Heterocapsa_arctica.AAC.1
MSCALDEHREGFGTDELQLDDRNRRRHPEQVNSIFNDIDNDIISDQIEELATTRSSRAKRIAKRRRAARGR